MKKQFKLLEATRKNLLDAVKDMTLEQLNHIPMGFNNNLIWNMGHVLVTQQLLCYALAGVACKVDNAMIAKYRKGTKPTEAVEAEEVVFIKQRMVETIEETKSDVAAGNFKNFNEYPTSYGITLHSLEEAIEFNNLHEAMHFGYVLALKHAL
ncbi:MAG: DinB family protein [Chitinophagales bacterium]